MDAKADLSVRWAQTPHYWIPLVGLRKHCCNLPKIQTYRPNLNVFCQKDANGIAKSEDPDQTAPMSSLIWVCTVCPDLSVQKLRVITVQGENSLFFSSALKTAVLDLSIHHNHPAHVRESLTTVLHCLNFPSFQVIIQHTVKSLIFRHSKCLL